MRPTGAARSTPPSTRCAAGAILAVKGIGGYHLAVDATDERAVAELRRRKARDDKPFAVMVADAGRRPSARASSTPAAAAALDVAPAADRAGAPPARRATWPTRVAPGLPELGLMLPYSPLHHLLLAGVGRPLVMTSGNLSDEPIAHDDDDAVARLGPLVDGLLTHDRPIHIRCDDSVVRAAPGRLQVLRRSRGYAPEPLPLPFARRPAGARRRRRAEEHVSVAKDRDWVVPSHHIGDLEHLATYRSFLQAVDHLCAPLRRRAGGRRPRPAPGVPVDQVRRSSSTCPTVGVQHHHAHVAACMVEHGRTEPVLGLAFDGLGYGPDGTLWGGELLVADLGGFERVGHLRPVPMPGGVAAIREPWRMAAVWAARGRRDAAPCGARLPGVDAATPRRGARPRRARRQRP